MSINADGDPSTAIADPNRPSVGDPEAAEARARDILRENPDEPDALLMLAGALRMKGSLSTARAILESLAQTRPNFAPIQYELGLVLGGVGENVEATAALSRAVSLDPGHADAWYALGDQLVRMRSDRAEAAYAEYFNLTVGDPRLREAFAAFRDNRLERAGNLLRERLVADPRNVTALKLLAEIALRAQDYETAEARLSRCLEIAPDFGAARHRLASVYLTQGKLQNAIAESDRLLSVEPKNPQYRNVKALALFRAGAHRQAAAEYEILLKDSPNQPGAWVAYGDALRLLGRSEECIVAYKKASSLLPGTGEPYWNLASLPGFRFGDDELQAMEDQLTRPGVVGENRAKIHFALAKGLEDAARFDASFEHYRSANELVRAKLEYNPEDMTSLVRRSKALFTRAFVAERARWGCGARDPIFVVGLPRSGSALIATILSAHSAIAAPLELRAVGYIAGRLGGGRNPGDPAIRYPDALGEMEAKQFAALGDEVLMRAGRHRAPGREFYVDAMLENFAHVGLISLILPNAKIVDVRRHPLDCCLSNFKQRFRTGKNFSYSLSDLGRYYFDYVELMAHFDDVLPGKVHRVFHERMVEDPAAEVRRLFDHLGLPPEDGCLRVAEDARRAPGRDSGPVRAAISVDAPDHWRNYEAWLGPLTSSLGFVLETYPLVPRFFARLHSEFSQSGAAWNDERSWSGKPRLMDSTDPTTTPA